MLSTKCVYNSYIYLIYMYRLHLALNNLQWFACHKTKHKIDIEHILHDHCPVSWGCRIHWLHLFRWVRLPSPQWVSCIWHKTTWWWGPSDAGALGNAEHPFIAIAPRSTLAGVVAPDGLNRTNTYAKLNCLIKLDSLKLKCFWQLNHTYI